MMERPSRSGDTVKGLIGRTRKRQTPHSVKGLLIEGLGHHKARKTVDMRKVILLILSFSTWDEVRRRGTRSCVLSLIRCFFRPQECHNAVEQDVEGATRLDHDLGR